MIAAPCAPKMFLSRSCAPKMPLPLSHRTEKRKERKTKRKGLKSTIIGEKRPKMHIFCAKTHLDATFRNRFRLQFDRFRHHGHAVEACLLPPDRFRGVADDSEVFLRLVRVRGGGKGAVFVARHRRLLAACANTAPGLPKIRAPFFAPKPAPVGVAVAPRPPAVVVCGSAVEAGHDGLGQDFSPSDDPACDDARRGRDLLLL